MPEFDLPDDNWIHDVPESLCFIIDILRDPEGTGVLINSRFEGGDPEPPVPTFRIMQMVTAHLMNTCAKKDPAGYKRGLKHLSLIAKSSK